MATRLLAIYVCLTQGSLGPEAVPVVAVVLQEVGVGGIRAGGDNGPAHTHTRA